MALARLTLKDLRQKLFASSSLAGHGSGGVHKQRWNNELLKRFGTAAAGDKGKSEANEGKKSNGTISSSTFSCCTFKVTFNFEC